MNDDPREVALKRELRAEADRLGINPRTASDEQMRPLLRLLPKELVQDARNIEKEMGVPSNSDASLLALLRLLFRQMESEQQPVLN